MKSFKKIFALWLVVNFLTVNLVFLPTPTQAAVQNWSPSVSYLAQNGFYDSYIQPLVDLVIPNPAPKITKINYDNGQVYIEWENKNLTNFTSYVLERSTNNYGWTTVKTITDQKITYLYDTQSSNLNSLKYRLITNADKTYTSPEVFALDNTFIVLKYELRAEGGYIEWQAPTQETSNYLIQRQIDDGNFQDLITKDNTWNYHLDKSIPNTAKTVSYKIIANLSDGKKIEAGPVTIKISEQTDVSTSTPQITQAVYQDGRTYVEWERVKTDGFVSYILERSVNEYSWSKVIEINDPSLNYYNDRPGSSLTSLKYRVTTNADQTYTSNPVYALDNSFKIKRGELDPTGAGYIEWDKPAREVKEYKIFHALNNGAFTLVEKVSGSYWYYQDSAVSLTSGLNVLQYKVEAVLTDGSTITTDPITVLNEAPAADVNPNLTNADYYSAGYVNLKWTKPSKATNNIVYEVWRSTNGTYFYPVNQNINQLYYLDNLGTNTAYNTLAYKIVAVDQGVYGESNVKYAKDETFAIKSASLVGDFVYLEWSTPAQAVSGYHIFRTYDAPPQSGEPNMTKIADKPANNYYHQDENVDINQPYIAYRIQADIPGYGSKYTGIIYFKDGGTNPVPIDEILNPEGVPAGSTYPYSQDYRTGSGRSAAATALQIASGLLSGLILSGQNYNPDAPADCNDAVSIFSNDLLFENGAPGYDICGDVTRRFPNATLRDVVAETILRRPQSVNTEGVAGPGFNLPDAGDAGSPLDMAEGQESSRKNGLLTDDVVGRPVRTYIGNGDNKVGVDQNGNIVNQYGKSTGYTYNQETGDILNENGQPSGYKVNENGDIVNSTTNEPIDPNDPAGVPWAPEGGSGSGPSNGGTGNGGTAKENLGKYTEFIKGLNPWNQDKLQDVIASILKLATTMAGLIAVAFIIYGGYMYITSGGNPEKSKKATEAVTYAAIGLVVVLAAYAIVNTVLSVLGGATSF